MRKLRLNAMATVIAVAALSACGGGGGEPVAEAPAPVPAPSPQPPAPLLPVNFLSSSSANVAPGGMLIFNVGNGNLIAVDDPDSAALTTTVSLSAGLLSVAAGSGATVSGDATANVTVSGTISQVNAALNGMAFTAPGTAQTVEMQIVTQDGSAPTPLSDTDVVTIDVRVTAFQTFQPASIVLGQLNFTSRVGGAASQGKIGGPRGAVAIANDKIYVPDTAHNRVLVFSANSPSGALADFVLGQEDFNDQGAVVEQGSHPGAAHVAIAAGRMAVAERSSNRVSLYSTVPLASTQLPQAILGQDIFTTSNAGCHASRLNQPESVSITPDGNNLVVADTQNNRVNIYLGFPMNINSGAPFTDVHLGQATSGQGGTTGCDPNAGQPNPHSGTLNQPRGVWTDGNRVVVADTGNNRVLIWNSFPSANMDGGFVFADQVLGQANFSSVLPNRGATPGDATLSGPTHVASDGTRLAVADTGNHRILIWTTFPTGDGVSAQVIIGQQEADNAASNDSNQDGTSETSPSDRVFFRPTGLHFHGGKLYVSDQDNNRILIFEPQ